MNCIYCTDGIIQEGNSFYMCPHCSKKREFLDSLEMTIAKFALDGREEEAIELHKIYELLQTSPVLAIMEAEHQEKCEKVIEYMKEIFEVKDMR